MSAAFALAADTAMMTLGGALKRKERLSARLGDVLSEMYLTSAVLKQFEDDGSPEADLPLLHWACENAFYRMQESLRLLIRNLPFRPLAWLLRIKRVFGLVIDFGTSQSPKSTQPLTTYWCPSRPGHQALRNNFASSLLLRTWLPYDWTPRSEAYFVFPLAQGTPGKQCGLAATGVYQPSLRSPWLAASEKLS